ncbi:MAG: hypothetical protein FJ125_15340, partial [Deltaproteobacteria bacterium]|nr:hypothetical protein [Deltaproteobacteria bacterium]
MSQNLLFSDDELQEMGVAIARADVPPSLTAEQPAAVRHRPPKPLPPPPSQPAGAADPLPAKDGPPPPLPLSDQPVPVPCESCGAYGSLAVAPLEPLLGDPFTSPLPPLDGGGPVEGSGSPREHDPPTEERTITEPDREQAKVGTPSP